LLVDVTFRTVIAKFTQKVETELREVDKRIRVRGLSLNQQQSLKVVIVGQNSVNS